MPSANASEVTAIYTRWAFAYDAFTWLTERSSLRRALAEARVRDGQAVLEVAVGTGVAFRDLLRANPSGRNAGIDLTAAMLRRARAKADETGVPFELAVADARALPFADASFDRLMNNNMFGLVPERDFAPILGEMRRVLRPGGRLVIVTMTRPRARLAEWLYELVPIRLGGWRDVDMQPHVLAAGFEVVTRDVVEELGVPSEVLVARRA